MTQEIQGTDWAAVEIVRKSLKTNGLDKIFKTCEPESGWRAARHLKTFVVETRRKKVLFVSERRPDYLFSLPIDVRRIYEATKQDIHEFNRQKEGK